MTAGAHGLPPRSERSDEAYLTKLRWPDAVVCPKCGSADLSIRTKRPVTQWRCRTCRGDFTVTTHTAMHGSKVGIAKWIAAAQRVDISPSALVRELGVSAPAARRISAALEMTGKPAGEDRLMALLHQHHDPAQALRDRLPATFDPDDNPVADLSRGQRAVMGVLRNRIRGTALDQVAAEAGLSEDHARRCLKSLAQRGYARCEEASVPWGYGSLKLPLWSLDLNEECITAMAYLPPRPEKTDHACPEQVPPEFWSLFWSGSSAKDLRLPEDAFFVATTLLDGPDPVARTWALRCLPKEALQRCRKMRGYDTGEFAARIDKALAQRVHA